MAPLARRAHQGRRGGWGSVASTSPSDRPETGSGEANRNLRLPTYPPETRASCGPLNEPATSYLYCGRLLEFPSAQAAPSLVAPWDPGPEFGAMGRRRPAFSVQTRNAETQHFCGSPRRRTAGSRSFPHFFACQHAQTRSQPIARRVAIVV